MSHAAWNERSLSRPVLNTRPQSCPQLDLIALRSLLDRAIHTTFARTPFNEVAALASRLIARRSASFRSQYGFKLMRKCNIALCRLHECNVLPALEDLLATLPEYRIGGAAALLELPTRDTVDWVLVRVRSLAQLLWRAVRQAREASELFLYYVHKRHFLETALMHVAVLADVWQLARRLCEQTVEFYDALRPLAGHFGGRQQWLRSVTAMEQSNLDEVLPMRLAEALGEDWEEELRRAMLGAAAAQRPLAEMAGTGGGDVTAMFGFDKDDSDILADIPSAEKEKSVAAAMAAKKPPPKVKLSIAADPGRTTLPTNNPSQQHPIIQDDIGEAIVRPVAASLASKQQQSASAKQAPAKPALRLEQLVSVDDVQAFMKTERVRLTQGEGVLSVERWKELQKKCNNILVTTQGKNTVRTFRKWWMQAVLGAKVMGGGKMK